MDDPGLRQQVPAQALDRLPVAICRLRHASGALLAGVHDVWPIYREKVIFLPH